jgi:hypothetical protein
LPDIFIPAPGQPQFSLNHRSIYALTLVLSVVGCGSQASELREQCVEARKKAIDFLAAQQQENGALPTQRWVTTNPANTTSFDSPFTAAQVLYSLEFCQDAKSAEVRERAARYLLSQEEPPGVWRYLGKGGYYSADVEDTAVVWAALKRLGHSIPSEALRVVRESKNEAGLFNTWIGDPSTWVGLQSADKEIDRVINTNVLFLFGLASENIAPVCDHLLSEIDSERFLRGSVYYPSPLVFTSVFSRAYAEGSVTCLKKGVEKIRTATVKLQQPDGGWGDDLETACGLLTLINLGEKGEIIERGLTNLIARQMSDGGWALNTVYRGAKVPVRFGSRSHTTALSVEVLAKYLAR